MSTDRVKALFIEGTCNPNGQLADLVSSEPDIEIIRSMADPFAARERIKECKPDVLVLDLEMIRMDAMLFLRILMSQAPMPVVAVMASSNARGSWLALDALELGVAEVFVRSSSAHIAPGQCRDLCNKIKTAAKTTFHLAPKKSAKDDPSTPGEEKHLILLGASTGGTEALREILLHLPTDLPPILIVQHIPADFSGPFAERLNSFCKITVKHAENGDVLKEGMAFVAPGDRHMLVTKDSKGNPMLNIRDGEKIMHHRPSIDLLFDSAANYFGRNIVAGVLTGMGRDGASGLLKLRGSGAKTFAQDEATSIVYGMPKAAKDLRAAEKILPLHEIAAYLVRSCRTA